MPHLKAGRIIQRPRCGPNGVDDLLATVSRIDAPQPGHAVEDRPPFGVHVVHVLG